MKNLNNLIRIKDKGLGIQSKSSGFTLIELLVVIAIIGILSSVVLVSLQTTREKGKDASAKVSMTNILTAAELYYDGNQPPYTLSYTGFCDITKSLEYKRLKEAVEKLVPAPDSGEKVVCTPGDRSYRVYTKLNTGKYFCVDSRGSAGEGTEPNSNTDECPF